MNAETTQTAEAEVMPVVEAEFDVPEGYKLLSDAEMEALARQLVEDHREAWKIQDLADSAVIAGEELDLIRDEYFYQFQQGGKTIRGLTAKMIGDLATANGISEVIEAREHVEDDEKHEMTVVVEMPDPIRPERMLNRSGFAEEPKMLYGKPDKFAKQKAYTKAFRRACEKLLPQALLIATKLKLARLVPADWTPQQAQPKALPAPNGNTEREKARKAMFAQYGERKNYLATLGITEDMLKEGILKKFGVKSRDELTQSQYVEIRESLTGDIADWVRSLAPKEKKKGTAKEKAA